MKKIIIFLLTFICLVGLASATDDEGVSIRVFLFDMDGNPMGELIMDDEPNVETTVVDEPETTDEPTLNEDDKKGRHKKYFKKHRKRHRRR